MVDFKKRMKLKKELEEATKDEPIYDYYDESVMKQGEMTLSHSMGSKDESLLGLENTQSSPTIERTPLEPKEFKEGQYSKVKINCGHTLSLGDFMFYRCDVGIEEFCRPNEKAFTLDEIKETAKSFLLKEVQKVKAKNAENRQKKRKRYQ